LAADFNWSSGCAHKSNWLRIREEISPIAPNFWIARLGEQAGV
jgi:hypothetical protein